MICWFIWIKYLKAVLHIMILHVAGKFNEEEYCKYMFLKLNIGSFYVKKHPSKAWLHSLSLTNTRICNPWRLFLYQSLKLWMLRGCGLLGLEGWKNTHCLWFVNIHIWTCSCMQFQLVLLSFIFNLKVIELF